MHLNPTFLRISALAFVAVIAPGAIARDDVRIGKSFVVSKAKIIDTTKLVPQIKEGVERENEKVPSNPSLRANLGAGLPNNLKAGLPGAFDRIGPVKFYPGLTMNGSYPPDTDLAIGPKYIVQVVNSQIGFFDLTGKRLFQNESTTFFSGLGAGSFQFDPKVIYDAVSKRFMILFLEEDDKSKTSKLLIAVSDDDNPNGIWYKYRVESKLTQNSKDFWLDYPGFGTSSDHVVISGNMFSFDSSDYAGNQFVVLSKTPMLTGQAVTASSIVVGDAGTVKVALNPEPSTVTYATSWESTTSVRMYAIANDAAGKPVLSISPLAIPTANYAPYTVRSSAGVLDTLSDRFINAAVRSDRFTMAHSIMSSTSSSNSMVRWYDINLNKWPTSGIAPTLAQSGDVPGTTGFSTLQPSVNFNKYGDLALAFTRVSASSTPEFVVAGRRKKDPAGTVSRQKVLSVSASSPSTQMGGRWGDYSAVVVDPTDGFTYWATNETIGSNGFWTSDFSKFTITTPGSELPPFAATNPAVWKDPSSGITQGTYVGGSGASLAETDGASYLVRSTGVARLGQSAGIEMQFNTTPSTEELVAMSVKLLSTGTSSASQSIFVYNWKTKKYDHCLTTPISGKVGTFSLPVSPTNYIYKTTFGTSPGTANGVVKVVIRGVSPLVRGAMPGSFIYGVDEVKLILE